MVATRFNGGSAALAAALVFVGCGAGADGPMGATGAEGPQGIQGDPGEDGQDLTMGVVVPPYYKGTYQALAADWARWHDSMPTSAHPLEDTANCDTNQSGPVFFLGGATSSATLTRDNCTIPAGKAIFFPLVNTGYHNIDENPQLTAEELHQQNSFYWTGFVGATAEVDGVPVPNIEDYEVHTEVFVFDFVADGPSSTPSTPSGTSTGVNYGVFLLLNPPAPGSHTIHFTGNLLFTLAEHGFDLVFDLDLTYNIDVAP